jgi:hypothetical protein
MAAPFTRGQPGDLRPGAGRRGGGVYHRVEGAGSGAAGAAVEAVRFYTLDHEQRMPRRWEDLELYLKPDPAAPSGVRAIQPDRQTLLNGQASVDSRVRAYLDRMSVIAEFNSEVKQINIMTEEHTILVQEKNYDNRGHRIVGYSNGNAVDMTEVDKRTRWIEGQ